MSRGGRYLLCAAEHLRPAESEELGGAFQSRVMQQFLLHLVQNLDDEKEDIFADARDPQAPAKRKSAEEDLMPERRIMVKGRVKMVRKRGASEPIGADEVPEDEEDEEMVAAAREEVHALFEEAGIDLPVPTSDEEALMAENEVYVLERRVPKSLIKQGGEVGTNTREGEAPV